MIKHITLRSRFCDCNTGACVHSGWGGGGGGGGGGTHQACEELLDTQSGTMVHQISLRKQHDLQAPERDFALKACGDERQRDMHPPHGFT